MNDFTVLNYTNPQNLCVIGLAFPTKHLSDSKPTVASSQNHHQNDQSSMSPYTLIGSQWKELARVPSKNF
jgi:hypothetical protein